jgi:hypothetical protein
MNGRVGLAGDLALRDGRWSLGTASSRQTRVQIPQPRPHAADTEQGTDRRTSRMAVLADTISVVAGRESIQRKYPGDRITLRDLFGLDEVEGNDRDSRERDCVLMWALPSLTYGFSSRSPRSRVIREF